MTRFEEFLLKFTGKIIIATGFSGFILTLFFDYIARGIPSAMGWLQTSGMLIFFLLFGLGIAIDDMLRKAKKMIEDYLKT